MSARLTAGARSYLLQLLRLESCRALPCVFSVPYGGADRSPPSSCTPLSQWQFTVIHLCAVRSAPVECMASDRVSLQPGLLHSVIRPALTHVPQTLSSL